MNPPTAMIGWVLRAVVADPFRTVTPSITTVISAAVAVCENIARKEIYPGPLTFSRSVKPALATKSVVRQLANPDTRADE